MNMRGSYWHLPAHVTTKHKCFWEAERIHEVPGFRNVNKSKAFNLQPLVEAKQLNASLTEDHKLSLAIIMKRLCLYGAIYVELSLFALRIL